MVSLSFQVIADFGDVGTVFDESVRAVHSGNAGDVIYSIPAMRSAAVEHLLLNIYEHPRDPLRRLSEASGRALVPLLLSQGFLKRVTIVRTGVPLESVADGQLPIRYILDRFRLEDIDRIHLILAHARALRVPVDVSAPFLTVTAERIASRVSVAFTPRYRWLSSTAASHWMSVFRDPWILGLPHELHAVAGISGTPHTCADFLELARLLQGSPLFVGNPSLISAIAEGLKIPRIIDLPPPPANAFPLGPNGYLLPSCVSGFHDLVARLADENQTLMDCLRGLETASELRSRLEVVERRAADLESRLCREPGADLRGAERQVRQPDGSGRVGLSTLLAQHPWQVDAVQPSYFQAADDNLLLHPAKDNETCTALVIEGLRLERAYCFEAKLFVSHPEAQPVRYSFELRQRDGHQILHRTAVVLPQEPLHWQIWVAATDGPVTLRLSTAMLTPGSNAYAWAWWHELTFVDT